MRLFVCAALLCAGMASAETWRGLTVAPEHCCSPYRAADYSYPQSVDPLIVAQIGKVYGPYTGRCFASSSTWWRGRKRMTAGCAPPLPRPPPLVRCKYGLTIDLREADAQERVLSACPSMEMVFGECAPVSEPSGDPLDLYDDNDNRRITCAEARRHGIAPVPRSHPAYCYMRDADGGVCE